MRNPLPALLLLAAIPCAQAEEDAIRYYDVELIVFERNDPVADIEQWPAVMERPGPGVSLDRSGFQALGRNQGTLNPAYLSLARSPAYTPLAHLHWRQPGLDAAHAVPVRIQAGALFEAPPEPWPIAAHDAAPSIEKATKTRQRPPLLHQLEGTVKVALGRYLHVYTDLVLRRWMPEEFVAENRIGGRPEETDIGAGFAAPTTYLHEFPMRQHRRMRSNETHYLDHPMMGLIVIIRRAEIATPS